MCGHAEVSSARRPRRESACLNRVADAGPLARRSCPTPPTEITPRHENRHLQRQRHHRPAAAPARMARRVGTRRRLPAGAEDLGRDLSGRRPSRGAGYSARFWHGQKGFNGVAILARGDDLVERRRGLPGDPDDTHSRYIEVRTHGLVVASIYLPNGNPQPGPKFAYKLAWFERLAAHAQGLIASDQPVVLAGDYNVVATDEVGDIYSPRSYLNDALLQPETRSAYRGLLGQGWTRFDPAPAPGPGRSIPTGITSASGSSATPGCASTTCCSTRQRSRAWPRPASTSTCAHARSRATTRRPGSS